MDYLSTADMFAKLCETLTLNHPIVGNKAEMLVSHTTIGAFKISNGRGIAFSDGQVTEGEGVSDLEFKKVIPIDSYSLMLISGVPQVAIKAARIMEMTIRHHLLINKRLLTTRAKVKFIGELLFRNIPLAINTGLPFVPIFITYDNDRSVRIFSFSLDGSSIERKEYALGGSGRTAWACMKECWRENLSQEEGVKLASHYLDVATANDRNSGGKKRIYLVSEDGISDVSEEQ